MKKKTATINAAPATKVKTPEQIMQANLRKTMRGLKKEVADAEELWLEIFSDILTGLVANAYEQGQVPEGEAAFMAACRVTNFAMLIANSAVDKYEARWGTAR